MATWSRRLSTSWRRVRTEPGLGRNVLVIAVLITLATVSGSIILSNQRYTPPWAAKYVVNATFEAAPGVSPGNGQEVRIAGVPVGEITQAGVSADGQAVLRMEMEPGSQIYDNATLVMRPKSLLNEMYVTIGPGGPPGELVESGGTLPAANSKRPIQVDEILGHLDDDARVALTSLLAESDDALASAPSDLPRGFDGVSQVAENLKPVVQELDERRENLRTLVTAVSQISASVGQNDARLTELAGSLETTLGGIVAQGSAVDSTLAQLPAFTTDLRAATEAVQALSDELDPTLRNVQAASDSLPDALARTTDLADRLDSTLDVARPFVSAARPVVADLRPFVSEVTVALPEFQRSTAALDPITATVTNYLPDLGAFFVQTRSFTSLRDGNAGILRGLFDQTPTILSTSAGQAAERGPGPVGPTGATYTDRGESGFGDVDGADPLLAPPLANELPR